MLATCGMKFRATCSVLGVEEVAFPSASISESRFLLNLFAVAEMQGLPPPWYNGIYAGTDLKRSKGSAMIVRHFFYVSVHVSCLTASQTQQCGRAEFSL